MERNREPQRIVRELGIPKDGWRGNRAPKGWIGNRGEKQGTPKDGGGIE